jgi:hypothetical protein
MASRNAHPVPTERRVFLSALDTRLMNVSVETLLEQRGFDLSQPYRQEHDHGLGEGVLYVQDIPPREEA